MPPQPIFPSRIFSIHFMYLIASGAFLHSRALLATKAITNQSWLFRSQN
ncbi:hypothetical protein NC652_026362 [Populus alba x Populus x berolinensis]|nr:hypothetical protein NC652_026362 [Populus alba x Populus x berolinensis]